MKRHPSSPARWWSRLSALDDWGEDELEATDASLLRGGLTSRSLQGAHTGPQTARARDPTARRRSANGFPRGGRRCPKPYQLLYDPRVLSPWTTTSR